VTKLFEADPAREVAVFGAVWVKAPMSRYIAAVKDIEKFEKGNNFLVTKRISDPPRLEDFDQLTLPEEDVKDLKTCKVGDCELKLSEASLTRIQKETDWSKLTATADVERAIRKLALEFVDGYLEGGNARLATYRDSNRPTFVAQEFSSMVDRMPVADVSSRPQAVPSRVSEGQPAEFGILPVLAERQVRVEADDSHQTSDDC
jgi:hypothetical protein